MKTMSINIILFLFVFFFGFGSLVNAEIIRIKGGVIIKGQIVKRGIKVVIVDIGYDLLRIPAQEVLKITKDRDLKKPVINKSTNLYRAVNLKPFTTSEGFQSFAPSVVLVRTPRGLGSGFFVNKRGYVVTNFHVIKGQKHITVTRFEKKGSELKRTIHKKVRIVALDPFHDLAVLQVKENIKKIIVPGILSPHDRVKVGEKIFVIGNPLGLERTVTQGVVSHSGRMFSGKVYLQVDASVNPGNSGGPLFNSNGQIIGVINMSARTMQGLNFAIPVHYVKFLLDHVDIFAYDETNSQSGFIYLDPPNNPNRNK
ncbi:S1C family serine protease [Spirochaetota bacterium]